MNQKKRELGQNELADTLESNYERIKPHLPKIIMFSVVGVLGILAVAFWLHTRRSINEDQWREYFVSSRFTDSRGMAAVAEYFPNTAVGQLALLSGGDSDFANGSNQVIEKRDDYEAKLKKAADQYKQIIESSSNASPFARVRATYALGYTYEALGRFEEARELYQELVDSQADTPVGELAAKSLARINDPSLTSIHAAFAEWEPATEAPGESITLPPRPDISFPAEPQEPATGDPTPANVPTPAADPGDAAKTDDNSAADPDKKSDGQEQSGGGEKGSGENEEGGGETESGDGSGS